MTDTEPHWYRNLSDVQGLNYKSRCDVDPTRLPGYGMEPLRDEKGELLIPIRWPYEDTEFGSPATRYAYDPKTPTDDTEQNLQRIWNAFELPGTPLEYSLLVDRLRFRWASIDESSKKCLDSISKHLQKKCERIRSLGSINEMKIRLQEGDLESAIKIATYCNHRDKEKYHQRFQNLVLEATISGQAGGDPLIVPPEQYSEVEDIGQVFLNGLLKSEIRADAYVNASGHRDIQLSNVNPSLKEKLHALFSPEAQESRGIWYLDEKVRVHLGFLNLCGIFRSRRDNPTAAVLEQSTTVRPATSPEAVFVWSYICPMLADIWAPIILRGPNVGDSKADAAAWTKYHQLIERLGIRSFDALKQMTYGNGGNGWVGRSQKHAQEDWPIPSWSK